MSLDDSFLYFGRTQRVDLVPSDGRARLVRNRGYEIPSSNRNSDVSALLFRDSVKLGDDLVEVKSGSLLVFPQVPATVPEMRKGDEEEEGNFPHCLLQPLQKATCEDDREEGRVKVYVSGVRSAIMVEGGEKYRLKGCGNGICNSLITNPFPARIVGQDNLRKNVNVNGKDYEEEMKKELEIRGVMFNFTSFREQALTSIVNQAILAKNIPIANHPIGFFQYFEFPIQSKKDSHETNVSLCCGLYRTFGDKRLASHLLWGLELLIPIIFKDPSHDKEEKIEEEKVEMLNLLQPFSDSVSIPTTSNGSSSSSWIETLFPSSRRLGNSEVIDTGFAALEGPKFLINLSDFQIPKNHLSDSFYNQINLSNILIPSMPDSSDKDIWSNRWNLLWTYLLLPNDDDHLTPASSSSSSSSSSNRNLGNLLAFIYWEIGRQAGKILQTIHNANINWGTYDDLLGNHCNSHPNNLVVLQEEDVILQMKEMKNDVDDLLPSSLSAPSSSCESNHLPVETSSFFLAPLDFDLAFTKDSFIPSIPIQQEHPSIDSPIDSTMSQIITPHQQHVDAMWNELKEMEVNAMLLALGGLNLNTGVEGRAEIPLPFEPIRVGLRDTMVKSFNASYRNIADVEETAPKQSFSSKDVHSMIKLALILSENIIS
jgi:hypothetical protein